MKSSGIGGQAVMEGVMMRNKSKYAVAVRKEDKEIVVDVQEHKSFSEKYPVFGLPVLRGVVAFIESLVMGIKILTYSASFFEDEDEKAKEVSAKKENVYMGMTVLLSIVMALGIFFVIPLLISEFLTSKIDNNVVLVLIEGIIRILMLVGYIAGISQMNDIKRFFRYHGAEHKTINCIEKGLDLSIANVRKQSKEHKRCGTSFLLFGFIISMIVFSFVRVDTVWLRLILRLVLIPVIAGISYEFLKLAGNSDNVVVNILSKPGLWLQGLTTKEPDDDMIEVAIVSVEAVFDWQAYVNEVRQEKKSGSKKNVPQKQTKDSSEKKTEKKIEKKAESKAAVEKRTEKKETVTGKPVAEKKAEKKPETKSGEQKIYKSHNAVAEEIAATSENETTKVSDNDDDDEILNALDKYFEFKKDSQEP